MLLSQGMPLDQQNKVEVKAIPFCFIYACEKEKDKSMMRLCC